MMRLRRRFVIVADAAAQLDIGPDTLRRLERLGRIPLARRDPISGYRVYDAAAIEHLRQALSEMQSSRTRMMA